ncbi:MAG: DUF2853 family protein [Sphingomonadaceae bacterium]
MAEDWAIDVRKYAPDAEDAVIQGIVRHCGIALRNRDSSLVSFTDPAETDRVRESFCRKKLGLTDPDEVLDAAIAKVGERMKADTTRNRVTVYYLLAEYFGKLSLFGATGAAAAASATPVEPDPAPLAAMDAPAPPPPPPPPPPPVSPPPLSAAAMSAIGSTTPSPSPLASPRPKAGDDEPDRGFFGFGAGALALIAGGILVAALVGLLATGGMDRKAPAPTVALNPSAPPVGGPGVLGSVPAAGGAPAPAVPQGAGVLASEVEGRPQLSVYFDTASSEVTPEFPTVAARIKAWIDANPNDRLVVSGYNDPRGDPAFNAELSKNRAQSVQAALERLGVPASAIDLEKPAETTDTSTTLENARRVDIVVRPGG